MRKIDRKTVSVGIPAYNEEANIGHLLNDLLAQETENFLFEKIYVYSDGSTDGTNEIVRSFQNQRIELIVGPGRQGQAHGQNKIIDFCKSDCLVFINADMQINDKAFLFSLTESILKGEADLSSGNLQPLPAKTFFEKILITSVSLKEILFENYLFGNNLYTCRGAARAFSRRFYTSICFSRSVGEDAYSYLVCIKKGYQYVYTKKAILYYRLPGNLDDHRKQSTRFFQGKENFFAEFGRNFVSQHMHIPPSVYGMSILRAVPILIQKPVYVLLYIGVVLLMKIEASWRVPATDIWSVAGSSKQLR